MRMQSRSFSPIQIAQIVYGMMRALFSERKKANIKKHHVFEREHN
jgi:hypothetical protein